MLELADGIAEEAALVGAAVVGGDLTARATSSSISVTALGVAATAAPVRRSGARPGDVVALAGRQGWAAAGLAVLGRGSARPRALVEAYRRPEPPYAAGPRPRGLGATAMIDVSDGLLADLGHVADGQRRRRSTSTRGASRSPSRCRRSAPRSAPTRCAFVLGRRRRPRAGRRRSRRHGAARAAGRVIGDGAPRARASPSTARAYEGRPAGTTSDRPAGTHRIAVT